MAQQMMNTNFLTQENLMIENKQLENHNFYSLDGDKIGSAIEAYLIKSETQSLSEFSVKVINVLEAIKERVLKKAGIIIICAGDSIMFQGGFDDDWCKSILQQFQISTGRTASMGIGKTPINAYLALKLAKADGGGKIVYYPLNVSNS